MIKKPKLTITSIIISSLITLLIPFFIPKSQQFVLSPDPTISQAYDQADLERTRQVIVGRLSALDIPGWPRAKLKDRSIVINISASADETKVIQTLTSTGELELIDTGVEFPQIRADYRIRTGPIADPDQNIYQSLLTNADFVRAKPLQPKRDDFGLEITLTPQSAARLADFMANRHGIYLCLVQDKAIIGCPIVKLNGHQLEIRQGPTDMLVDDATLSGYINAGVLPLPLMTTQTTAQTGSH